jgi:hypothetical protein
MDQFVHLDRDQKELGSRRKEKSFIAQRYPSKCCDDFWIGDTEQARPERSGQKHECHRRAVKWANLQAEYKSVVVDANVK